MRKQKQQVPPLRSAPVGMTILLEVQTFPLQTRLKVQTPPLQTRFEVNISAVQTKLSSRPERSRSSYLAELVRTTDAALRKERRTNFVNATKLNRKSGVA
jgi:hypothetical protein